MGLLAQASNDAEQSFIEFQSAIALDPEERIVYPPAIAAALLTQRTNDAVRLARDLAELAPDEAESLISLGHVYAISGQLDRAEKFFRKAVKQHPDNEQALLSLAQYFANTQRRSECIELLTSALEKRETPAPSLSLFLGLFHLECAQVAPNRQSSLNHTLSAVENLEIAQQLIPLDMETYIQLTTAYAESGQFDKAILILHQLRTADPSNPTTARLSFEISLAHNPYGETLALVDSLSAETGIPTDYWLKILIRRTLPAQRAQLASFMDQQIVAGSASAYLLAQRCAMYVETNQHAEAIQLLKIARAKFPNDPQLIAIAGFAQLYTQQFEAAYQSFVATRAAAHSTTWEETPLFSYNFMLAAQQSGNRTEALAALSTTYASDPQEAERYIRTLLSESCPIPVASRIDLLNAFAEEHPQLSGVQLALSSLYTFLNERNTALQHAQTYVQLIEGTDDAPPLSAGFYHQYAALHEQAGFIDEAEELFFKAIETGNPTIIAASKNYIAYMRAQRGEKLKQSLRLIEEALILEPENPAFLDTLGWVYYQLERYEEALDYLKKAQKILKDSDSELLDHLQKTRQKLSN